MAVVKGDVMYTRKALSRAGSGHDRPERRGNIVERIAAAREQRQEIAVSNDAIPGYTFPESSPDADLPDMDLRKELREIISRDALESANDTGEPTVTMLAEPRTRSPWMIYAAAIFVLAAAAVLLYAPQGDLTWLSARL